ncbi:MAG: response regulator [Armatimonadota bacterium]|nr:response regulator [Armatimonadota bacterium]
MAALAREVATYVDTRRKVLLVDDDAAILQLFEIVLTTHGFSVTAATGGGAAADFHARLGSVDLLITDIDMPGQSGIDLAAYLVKRQPNLPVLFITGGQYQLASSASNSRRGLLQKPFGAKALLASIDQVLALC